MYKNIENLKRLLISKNKRDGAIEDQQVEILLDAVQELSAEFATMDVDFDISMIENRRLDKNKLSISLDGKIIPSKGRDPYYDSKSFDAVLPIMIGDTKHVLYFIMKGVENSGGHQDNVKQEIALYTIQMKNNRDENVHFVFQLDGTYMLTKIINNPPPESDKYSITDSSRVKSIIRGYIFDHLDDTIKSGKSSKERRYPPLF